ncbi:hypothetical protein H1R20_g12913, partial [Candolleomyces eurysporus]
MSRVKDGEVRGDGGDGRREQTAKKDLEFRSDAKIWYLYLEDAEREAKDRMELWKTSLDSLLIFAGLFAGIVSSFLIDARHDLQENSEQNLLGDIRDSLQGMSVIDIVNIPVSQKWVNALWLISLYITLFGAIMGVLAKAWLAKFVPATTRREALDAYHRYKLDKQAELWYLEDVITLVPFLVQIAAFLFLGGLIVQSITDDETLGNALLGFCIAGCATYLTMTILPLFVPSSPFNTPLSDLLLWLGKMFAALVYWEWPSNSESLVKTDIDEGLAEILYNNLIKSPKPTHVDEAAAEIALPSFKKRTQILSLLKPLPEEDRKFNDSAPLEFDFHSDEMCDRPWDLAFQDITSSHRLHFMLAACRGVLQEKKNLKTTSIFILGLSLAKATVTELEDMTVLALNDTSSLPPGSELGAARPRKDILETLVSTFTLPSRAVRFHTFKMLNRVPVNMFNSVSIEIISNMIVYEDEDIREDGLRILVKLVTEEDEEKKRTNLVIPALLSSVESGFNHEPEQRLRTIAFVRTIWDDSDTPFHSLVEQFVPSLVEVALAADSIDVRQPALRLAKDLREEGLESEIQSAVLKSLNMRLESSDSWERFGALANLSKLLKGGGTRDISEEPLYALALSFNTDLVQGGFPDTFEKVVKAAIHDDSSSVRRVAKSILKEFSKDGRVNGMKPVNGLAWLEAAGKVPSSWLVRNNAVLVLEIFIEQLDFTNENLLKKLVEWAGADEDGDVRCSSLRLISTICKQHYLSSEMLETVKPTISSVKNKIIDIDSDEEDPSPWIHFFSDMVEQVPFPEAIPIILKLYVKADSASDLWKSEDFLTLGERENDSEYIKALEEALPQNLKVSLHDSRDDWPATVKWIKLLVAISRRPSLKKSVDKVLKGVANDVRDGIEAKPPPGPSVPEPDPGTPDSQEDQSDYAGATEYMSQSTLKPSLRRLLYRIGWNDRRIWADILATIAAHFPLEFQDAPTILFQIAQHDLDSDVQCACLKSLTRLSKQSVPRELMDTIVDHFDHFVDSLDWEVRFSYTQLLSTLGVTKDCELSDDVLRKISNQALRDDDYDCRSEAVNTFSNLIEAEDGDRNTTHRERYRQYVEDMVKKHFQDGVNDRRGKVRQSWVRLVGAQTKNAETPDPTKLLDIAIKNSEFDVRAEAMQALQRLLKDGNVAALLYAPEYTDRALTVLETITAPPKPEDEEFQALPKLIEAVIKEEKCNAAFETRDALYSLFQNGKPFRPEILSTGVFIARTAKLPDQRVDTILPKAIGPALILDAELKVRLAKRNVRSAAINLFGRLVGCVPGGGDKQPTHEKLLGQDGDSQIIPRLAEIVIKDDDDDLRITALQVFQLAYKATDEKLASRFRDAIKESLSKIIETSLKDQGNAKFRANAVSAVHILTGENTNDHFSDIVSPSVPQLLRIVLPLLIIDSAKLSRDVFIAIPPIAATISDAGKATVLRLAETLPISDDSAAAIARALTPMLRNTSSFARTTAIELLLKLYTTHRHSKPRFFESAIPEIISLAFDDNDVGGTRITAIQLLVAVSSGTDAKESIGEQKPERWAATSRSVLEQIKPLAAKCIALLQVEHLRPTVVELLSLMSLDANGK